MPTWFVLLAFVAAFSLVVAACGGDDDDDDDGGSTPGSTQTQSSGGDSGDGVRGFTEAGYKAAGLDKEKLVTIQAGQPIRIGISSALSGDVKGLGEPIA